MGQPLTGPSSYSIIAAASSVKGEAVAFEKFFALGATPCRPVQTWPCMLRCRGQGRRRSPAPSRRRRKQENTMQA